MRTQQPLRVDCTERNMWLQVRRRVGHASTGTQLAAQRRVGPNHSYPIGQDRNYHAGHPPQYSFAPVDAHTCLFALSGRSCAAVPATDAHQQQLFSSECALCCAVLLRTAWSLSAAPSLAKSTGPKISPNSRTRTAVCMHCASAQQEVSHKGRAAYRVRVRVGTNKEFAAQNGLEKALALPEVVQVRFRCSSHV